MTETNGSSLKEEWVTTEGLASWMTRYQDPTGFQCQLMIESETGKDVLSKAKAAIAHLEQVGCTPVPFGGRNASNQPSSSPQEVSVVGNEEPSPSAFRCMFHGVDMQKYTKGNHTWFAHHLENGKWCKGKWS